MNKVEKTIHFEEFSSVDELHEEGRIDYSLSRQIMQKAYAPYSHFKVGAVAVLSDGIRVLGNNQENAAYPSGICAERVALFQASALYPNEVITSLYITCEKDENICAPCGSCRQVISQYETKQGSAIEIYFPGGGGKILRAKSVKDLLPFPFIL